MAYWYTERAHSINFTCEYYDRACKAGQYFRYQKYRYIGTYCKAQEVYGYYAERYGIRECIGRKKILEQSQNTLTTGRSIYPKAFSAKVESKSLLGLTKYNETYQEYIKKQS